MNRPAVYTARPRSTFARCPACVSPRAECATVYRVLRPVLTNNAASSVLQLPTCAMSVSIGESVDCVPKIDDPFTKEQESLLQCKFKSYIPLMEMAFSSLTR